MDDILPSGNFLELATFDADGGAVASTIVVFGNPYGGSRASLNEQFDSWSTWVGIDDAFQWQTVDQVADAGTRDLRQSDKDGDGILDWIEDWLSSDDFCSILVEGYPDCPIVVTGQPVAYNSVQIDSSWEIRAYSDGNRSIWLDGRFLSYVTVEIEFTNGSNEGSISATRGEGSISYTANDGITYRIKFESNPTVPF